MAVLLVGSIQSISRRSTTHLSSLGAAGRGAPGPRRSLAWLVAQLHHPLRTRHKRLADRSAAWLHGGPVDRAVLGAVPVAKHLLLQAPQLRAELSAGAQGFGDGDQVADQVHPTQLVLLGGQVVVGREGIAHDNPAKGGAEQLDGGGC